MLDTFGFLIIGLFGISRVRDGGGSDDECVECSSLFLVNATIFFSKKGRPKEY